MIAPLQFARKTREWFRKRPASPALPRTPEVPAEALAPSRPRIGLALSSGGAKGLAHIGVIQVLEENGIHVDAVAGSSMGAYVGCLWAAGFNGKELAEFAAEITSWTDEEKTEASSWPTWSKETSEFPWHYDDQETCLILEGQVTITNEDGQVFDIQAGDWVVFPKGMSCTWKITRDVRKHYQFG